MLQINPRIKKLLKNNLVYDRLGEANNSTSIVNLENKKISDYDFLVVESGWGYYKSTATIPTVIFEKRNESFAQCYFQVKTYGGTNFVSLSYINSTSFKINGEIGADVQTIVYGVKIQ